MLPTDIIGEILSFISIVDVNETKALYDLIPNENTRLQIKKKICKEQIKKCIIDENNKLDFNSWLSIGDICYYIEINNNKLLHNELDQPAVICVNGEKHWYYNGVPHRELDQPAIIYANGNKHWYYNGELHRELDQPAVIYADGYQAWYYNGVPHRELDQPAVIYANVYQAWYYNGVPHRELNQPAVICADGEKFWYYNGKQQHMEQHTENN